MAPVPPDHVNVKLVDVIAELVKLVIFDGNVGILVEDEGVEPNEFTAVIIIAYVVPAVNPVKVAVLLLTEDDIGVAAEPFNENVYDVAPVPPDQLKLKPFCVIEEPVILVAAPGVFDVEIFVPPEEGPAFLYG